jgi:hypothetical protein
VADAELVDEVRAWLQRHGYVLEMEVAQAVSAHAEWVWQGDHYNDVLTDKVREIDVWGLWIDPPKKDEVHSLSVFFECKSTTAPWILFAGSSEPEYAAGLAHYDDNCERCRALEAGISQAFQDWGVDAYAITQKRDPKGIDHAQEAVQQAVSSAIGKTGTRQLIAEGHHEELMTTISVPAVVTRSPLVICSLGQNGEVNLAVDDRAHIEVALRRGEAGFEKYSVFVMSFSALNDFLEKMTAVLPSSKRIRNSQS